MRIVIASDIYYPMINGVAVFAHNLANGLAKDGHEVLVICPSFRGEYYEEIVNNVRTVHLTAKRFPFYPDQINQVPERTEWFGLPMPRLRYKYGIWWSINPWPEVKQVLDDFQPDVIHLQTAETIALAVVKYAKKFEVPLVSTGHAYPDNVTGQFKFLKPVKKPMDALLRAYMASFLRNAEYATMPTEMAIGDLVPKNRKRFKVTVEALSNGVDLSQFVPGKPNKDVLEKYGLMDGVKRILYVGRVDPEKSIEKVLEAFEIVRQKLIRVELVIVGDGIALQGLKRTVREKRLEDSVKFLGKIMMPELVEIYRSGSLFMTASKTETQGIVLIEAAAVGLPLVAVDAGAVGELCRTGVNGSLCAPDKSEEMAEATIQILINDDLRKKYSLGSIEIAKKHDIKRTMARFIEIYGQAIKLRQENS